MGIRFNVYACQKRLFAGLEDPVEPRLGRQTFGPLHWQSCWLFFKNPDVLDHPAAGHGGLERFNPAHDVIHVGGDDVVPVVELRPLAELVVKNFVNVGVRVPAFPALGRFEQASAIVLVVQGLAVGVGYLPHPTEGLKT